jgi:hypothetical protein
MVDTCAVSFTARDTTFTLLPGQTVVFRPTGPQIDSAGSVLRLRKAVPVTANGAGAATATVIPGPYLLEAQVDGKLTAVPCTVPDVASATIDDCIAAVGAETFSLLTAIMQGMGLHFRKTTSAVQSDPDIPVNGAAAVPDDDGLFQVYLKRPIPTPLLYLGPLFPGTTIPAGTLGAPGLRISGDTDTGLYSPTSNQLAAAVGGTLGWLLSATGLQINVPVTGSALTGSNLDETAGKLLKVGDYGLGAGSAVDVTDWNNATVSGAIYDGNGIANAPIATGWFIGTYHRMTSIFGIQKVTGVTGTGAGRSFERRLDAGTWTPWREVYNQASVLGTVAQSGGIPTGALIESGTNANGRYVRFADGTQICTHTLTVGAGASASGACFLSAESAWTFPAAFSAPPTISGHRSTAATLPYWLVGGSTSGSNTIGYMRVMSSVTFAAGIGMNVTAVGRWF